MVAFGASIFVTLLFTGAFFWYRGLQLGDNRAYGPLRSTTIFRCKRAEGTPLTWGEAMAGSTFVFFLMFWVYGVVPHQWLTWADAELNWRPDRLVFGPGNILQPQAEGGWLPVTITYRTLRDLIAVGIYGVLLGLNIWMWSLWQSRDQVADPAAKTPSEYGRPLVREGVNA